VNSEDLINLTALEIASGIKAKKFSVPEVAGSYIEEIEKTDKHFNAFLAVAKENAVKRASEIQARIDKGEDISPLAGVPIAVKDNISTEGLETTCASKMLKGYKPVFNAAIIEKLESAGLIIIGKNNMDEFSMGSSGENSAFGVVRNPWNDSRTAGGSSGGSAAAVAIGETPLAIGTDTGGSIRLPCSFCGVTGIKPTYGTVSRYGIAAYASSLDQAGPIAQNIEDCAALLSVISEKPFEYNNALTSNADLKGVKIGLPANFFSYSETAEDVKEKVLTAAKELEAAGAVLEEFEMPLMDYIIPAYCIIGFAEASSNLAKYDGLRFGYRSPNAKTLSEVYRLSRSEGLGMEVKRKIMFGSFVLSADQYDTYYRKAQQVRTLFIDEYKKLFNRFNMILSPVAPTTAYELGKNSGDEQNDQPWNKYLSDIFTASVNLAGLPAAALPCGFDKQGLPIGFQLIGSAFSEKKIIDVGRIYQGLTNHHKLKPKSASYVPLPNLRFEVCEKKNGESS